VATRPAAAQSAAAAGAGGRPAAATKPQATKVLALKIVGSYKKGPDGKLHDAFTVTDFNVKVGQPETLKIDNTPMTAGSSTSRTIVASSMTWCERCPCRGGEWGKPGSRVRRNSDVCGRQLASHPKSPWWPAIHAGLNHAED
jgi:hypothetical protein